MKIDHFKTILIVALLLIITILLISPQKDNEINKESLFEKQILCANNRENATSKMYDGYTYMSPYFYEIFYSPKTDTCVYTYGLVMSGESPYETGAFIIYDYFSSEELYSIEYYNNSEDMDLWSSTIRPIFNKEVEKYK